MTSKLTGERIENVAKLAGVSETTVREWVDYDWDNQDEHDEWLSVATDAEIASWILPRGTHILEI